MTITTRRLRNVFITVVVLYLIYKLFDVTTPQQCKVPVEHMSQFCKDLLFPH